MYKLIQHVPLNHSVKTLAQMNPNTDVNQQNRQLTIYKKNIPNQGPIEVVELKTFQIHKRLQHRYTIYALIVTLHKHKPDGFI